MSVNRIFKGPPGANNHVGKIAITSGAVEVGGDLIGIPGMGGIAFNVLNSLAKFVSNNGPFRFKDLNINTKFVNDIRKFTCSYSATLHLVILEIPDEFNMKFRSLVFLSQALYSMSWALKDKIITMDCDPNEGNMKKAKVSRKSRNKSVQF